MMRHSIPLLALLVLTGCAAMSNRTYNPHADETSCEFSSQVAIRLGLDAVGYIKRKEYPSALAAARAWRHTLDEVQRYCPGTRYDDPSFWQ